MFKRILAEPGSKALLVLPYVALVQEKVRWLRQAVQYLCPPTVDALDGNPAMPRPRDLDSIRVVGFFGGGKVRAGWDDFDIGVCTLEKACTALLPLTNKTDMVIGQYAGEYRH